MKLKLGGEILIIKINLINLYYNSFYVSLVQFLIKINCKSFEIDFNAVHCTKGIMSFLLYTLIGAKKYLLFLKNTICRMFVKILSKFVSYLFLVSSHIAKKNNEFLKVNISANVIGTD